RVLMSVTDPPVWHRPTARPALAERHRGSVTNGASSAGETMAHGPERPLAGCSTASQGLAWQAFGARDQLHGANLLAPGGPPGEASPLQWDSSSLPPPPPSVCRGVGLGARAARNPPAEGRGAGVGCAGGHQFSRPACWFRAASPPAGAPCPG